MGKQKTAISPTRSENYPEWFQQVIKSADLAEHSPVRGCMIIKPWGFALWENIQKNLDRRFKETGHKNAYFPLFIPLSFLKKEAQHVEGFAKECAVVTHHRLKKEGDELVPDGELEEPLIVRPTSEMIIGDAFARWIQSYRDLPILINQWANIVRWEMRTRLFLRTAEILWQEGHTAHETQPEAENKAKEMIYLYKSFLNEFLALDPIVGEKTESEKFPGAVDTYTIEMMMQDKKALQGGTSHFLGQNFSKSCEIQFQSREGTLEYPWMTSWGVSTRLIGALIMSHADDNGMVIPPKIAPDHIVILPILHKEETEDAILSFCEKLKTSLEKTPFAGRFLSVHIDKRDLRGGEKNWDWIKKGVPIRIEVGMKEVEQNMVCFTQRIRGPKEKEFLEFEMFLSQVSQILESFQEELLNQTKKFAQSNTVEIEDENEFYKFFQKEDCGFASCYYIDSAEIEKKIQEELSVTVRCFPLDQEHLKGKCIFTGKTTNKKAIFAKAY